MLETTGPFRRGRTQPSPRPSAQSVSKMLAMFSPNCRRPLPTALSNGYGSLEHDKVTRFRLQSVRWFALIRARHDESDVAHRFAVIQPHALELIDRHRAVPPGGVCDQHAVSDDAAENDEMIVAQSVDRHHDRCPLNQIIQLQLTQPFAPVDARNGGAGRSRAPRTTRTLGRRDL